VWNAAPPQVKANFNLLLHRVDKPGPTLEAVEARRTNEERICYGGLWTWQTSYGRSKGPIAEARRMGLDIEDVVDIASADESLQEEFSQFTKWVAAMAKQVQMDWWACSMELNKTDSDTNAVHLHAYVCLRPDKFKSPEWEKVALRISEWKWGGFLPTLRPARLKPNQNPVKVFSTGLYYDSCPKLGCIFRDSNQKVFEDRGPDPKAASPEKELLLRRCLRSPASSSSCVCSLRLATSSPAVWPMEGGNG
jgi:hypothetical protein